MSLDVIRTRLDPSSPNHYKDVRTFVADVRLIFKNVYLFHQVVFNNYDQNKEEITFLIILCNLLRHIKEDSTTYTKCRYLESFFDEQLAKWLPEFATASEMNALNGNIRSGSNSKNDNNNIRRSDTNRDNVDDDSPSPKRIKTLAV